VPKGSVVLVPFPFDDLSSTKVRPAVCLTGSIFPYGHVVLAFITSAPLSDILDTDLVLDPGEPGGGATGLRVASVLRLHRMMTVSATLIRRELGHLSPEMGREVDARLRALFDLV